MDGLGASKLTAPDFFLEALAATWAILGGILEPAGRPGAPKIEFYDAKNDTEIIEFS